MKRALISLWFIVYSLWLGFGQIAYAQQQETLELLTYYPAPYGVYRQLAATGENGVPPSTNPVSFNGENTLVAMNVAVNPDALQGNTYIPALLQVGGELRMDQAPPSTIHRTAVVGIQDVGLCGVGTANGGIGVVGLATGGVNIHDPSTGVMGMGFKGVRGQGTIPQGVEDILSSIDVTGIEAYAVRSAEHSGRAIGIKAEGTHTTHPGQGIGLSITGQGRGIEINLSGSHNDPMTGIYNHLTASGKQQNISGIYQSLSITGPYPDAPGGFGTYGAYFNTEITNSSNNLSIGGISNYVNTNGNGNVIGINNWTGGSNFPIGICNYINSSSSNGTMGIENILIHTGNGGNINGIYNSTSSYGSTSSTDHIYGIYTEGRIINPGSSGKAYGIYASAYTNGTGEAWAGWFAGNVQITGTLNGHAPDIAEYIPSPQSLEPGDVVVINPNNSPSVIISNKPYQTTVAGIISTQPGYLLGNKLEGNVGETKLAIAGRVPCKVDASYGEIKPGDLLTTSPTPGHAMKAKPIGEINGYPIYPQGCIVGKALEGLKEGKGKILVLVCLM